MRRPKFCQSLNSAGKRCEHRNKKHPMQNGRPLHKRGDVTWSEPINWGRVELDVAAFDSLHRVFAQDYFRVAPSPTEVLTEWWLAQARDEIERTVPKAVEYGSTDLVDIGRNLARLAGRTIADDEAEELGIYFYLEGKFARWRSAIMEGRRVSDDTMFDIGVYVRMAQRVRHAGNWPGIGMDQLAQDPNDIMHSMCAEPCGLGCTAPEHPIKQQTYGMEPQ